MNKKNLSRITKALSKLIPNRKVPSEILVEIDSTLATVLYEECDVDQYKFLETIRSGRHKKVDALYNLPKRKENGQEA